MNILAITPATWTITCIGWAIVFVALVLMVIVFKIVPKTLNYFTERKLRKEGKLEQDDHIGGVSGEENAAIAMAIYMYMNEQHDEESGVITIKHIERRYSPWSSKVYGMNNRTF